MVQSNRHKFMSDLMSQFIDLYWNMATLFLKKDGYSFV
jgi:hypothetical protein